MQRPPDTQPRYEQDLFAWLTANAELLRQGRLHEIDAVQIAEELEDMGKSEPDYSRSSADLGFRKQLAIGRFFGA